MKSFLQNNNIETYSKHIDKESVITERFIETSKNKIHNYMTSISKNVYINKLDGIVNKYKNTYHSKIKNKACCYKIKNPYINPSK